MAALNLGGHLFFNDNVTGPILLDTYISGDRITIISFPWFICIKDHIDIKSNRC